MKQDAKKNRRKEWFRKNRFLFRILIIQLILFVLFGSLLYVSKPVRPDEVKQINLVVDDTHHYRVVREDRFSITSNGVEYQFHNTGLSSAYPNSKLFDTIQIGDEIYISYVEQYSFFGKRNSVVEAKSDTEVYRSIEEYNSTSAFVPVIIIFAIVEFLFLSGIAIHVVVFRKRYRKASK